MRATTGGDGLSTGGTRGNRFVRAAGRGEEGQLARGCAEAAQAMSPGPGPTASPMHHPGAKPGSLPRTHHGGGIGGGVLTICRHEAEHLQPLLELAPGERAIRLLLTTASGSQGGIHLLALRHFPGRLRAG